MRRLQTDLDEISLGEIAAEDARDAARRARKGVQARPPRLDDDFANSSVRRNRSRRDHLCATLQAALEDELIPALASLRKAIRDARAAATG